MKCYFLVEAEVTDQRWVADYLKNVTPMVERRGGRYLARTPNVVPNIGIICPEQIL